MSKLVAVLVDEKEVESRKSVRPTFIFYALFTCFIAGVSAGFTYAFFPKNPSRLTPVEAARILQTQQGFAGYTLVSDSVGNGAVQHSIFCPYCANEIAAVNVTFMPEAKPKDWSRTAILEDITKPVKVARAEDRPLVAADLKALSKLKSQ